MISDHNLTEIVFYLSLFNPNKLNTSSKCNTYFFTNCADMFSLLNQLNFNSTSNKIKLETLNILFSNINWKALFENIKLDEKN